MAAEQRARFFTRRGPRGTSQVVDRDQGAVVASYSSALEALAARDRLARDLPAPAGWRRCPHCGHTFEPS